MTTTAPERLGAEPQAPGSPDIQRLGATNAGSDPRRWWALVIIAVSQLMIVLDASVVTIALPSA
ncbi:MAG: MFS transporter, partial [Acidimicrobiales bacterium]